MSADSYKVVGSNASPFAIKLRAIFRYRRLRHTWYLNRGAMAEATAQVRPSSITKVHFPDEAEDTWPVDSSPIAWRLWFLRAIVSVLDELCLPGRQERTMQETSCVAVPGG